MALLDTLDNSTVFCKLGLIDRIIFVNTRKRFIRGNFDNIKLVYLLKFCRFCRSSTRHTRKFIVKAEEVLEGNGSKRFGLMLYLNTLFGFNSLMQTLIIASAKHKTACKFINYDDLAVLNDIVNIALHDTVGADCLIYMMSDLYILGIVKIFDIKILFCFADSLGSKRCSARLFINNVIAVILCYIVARLIVHLFYLEHLKRCRKAVGTGIKLGGLIALTRDNKRSTGFVNKDRVNLVNNRKIMLALNSLLLINYHVITQVIKAKLVIGAIGYIRIIRRFFLVMIQAVDNETHRKTHKAVNLAHPLGVTLGKIIVDRNDMNALTRKRIKVCRKCCNESFTFTCFHFTYTSLMQNDTAQYLNGEMAHSEHSVTRLTASGKCLGKNIIKRLPFCQALFKFNCFSF